MEQTRKTLTTLYLGAIALGLLLVALGETDVLPAGLWAGDKLAETYAVGAMELLTICAIPLALRLFKFGAVARQLAARPASALLRWGVVRIAMIAVPMVANTLLYYLFMHVGFGYMAIIGLLCLAFVYPSPSRCVQETHPSD